MAVHIRKNGFWTNITYQIPPFSVSGTWTDETSNRFYRDNSGSEIQKASRIYTNNTGKLMLVRAVVGIDRIARGLPASDISGSFAIAYVNGQEVSRYRDNGTDSSQLIRFEVQFFVPNYGEYYVNCFNYGQNAWTGSSGSPNQPIVETVSWTEFTFQ